MINSQEFNQNSKHLSNKKTIIGFFIRCKDSKNYVKRGDMKNFFR